MPEHGQVAALQTGYVWVQFVYDPDRDGSYVVEWPDGTRERLRGTQLDEGDLVAPAEKTR